MSSPSSSGRRRGHAAGPEVIIYDPQGKSPHPAGDPDSESLQDAWADGFKAGHRMACDAMLETLASVKLTEADLMRSR